jgi:mannose-6-phosphate isomerase-like protein (cupin superfamily)
VNYSRRDLSLLLPALLAAAEAEAQTGPLPSKTFAFEDLTLKGKGRAVLNGKTHKGFGVECHETQLAPGEAPHAPHHHEHVEMFLVREGTMEVTISGKTSRIGPGGVGYVASNEEHGWKNVGTTTAHYFVIALGQERS